MSFVADLPIQNILLQFWSGLLKDPEIISTVSNTIWYGQIAVFKRNVILDSQENLKLWKEVATSQVFLHIFKV